jgi:hypothetical protein
MEINQSYISFSNKTSGTMYDKSLVTKVNTNNELLKDIRYNKAFEIILFTWKAKFWLQGIY